MVWDGYEDDEEEEEELPESDAGMRRQLLVPDAEDEVEDDRVCEECECDSSSCIKCVECERTVCAECDEGGAKCEYPRCRNQCCGNCVVTADGATAARTAVEKFVVVFEAWAYIRPLFSSIESHFVGYVGYRQ